MPIVKRARPHLGTIVTVGAEGAERLDEALLARAVEAAFADVAHIHDRMSFQSADSDLSAIGRLSGGETCRIDTATAECLAAAFGFARASDGVFDPVLPGACWRDVSLDGTTVAVRRPLRIDLSGIAKGFAVDRACAVLKAAGVVAGTVNAGGDLRVFGRGETVALTPRHDTPPAAVWIEDGALASSDVGGSRAEYGESCHRDGRSGTVIAQGFVSVAAPTCLVADALTKIVLAIGDDALPLLVRHHAIAYRHAPQTGWQTLGDET